MQNIPKDVGFGAIKHTRNPGVWRRVDQGFHQNLRLRSASDWALGRSWRSAEAPRRRIARRGATYLEGVFDGGTETPDVIASFEGDAKAQDFPSFLQLAPPLRDLLFVEVMRVAGVRGVRLGWGGRTHSSPRAGCGSRSGAATPRHSNLPNKMATHRGWNVQDRANSFLF